MPGAGRGRSRRGCPTPDSQVHPACTGRRRTERELHRALLWHRSFLLTAPPRLSHSLHCGASFRPSPGAPVRTPPGARRGRVVAQCCCRTSRGSAGCARPPLGVTCLCSRAPLGRRGVRGSHQGPTRRRRGRSVYRDEAVKSEQRRGRRFGPCRPPSRRARPGPRRPIQSGAMAEQGLGMASMIPALRELAG